MGMAASQARLLGLQARQTNLEYQGQQINQERTILSQQCTALYNSLLTMDVPTPPSTQDFTTIEYSGSDGATNFTIGTVKPSGETYSVEIKTSQTGNALQSDYGTKVVAQAGEKVNCTLIAEEDYTKPNGTYKAVNGEETPDFYITEIQKENLPDGAEAKNYMIKNSRIEELKSISKYVRTIALDTIINAQNGHIGGLSIALAHHNAATAKIKAKYPESEVMIGYTGTVIGAHSGPGTLALFFLGTER